MGLLCLTTFTSCMDNPVIHEYHTVDANGWSSTDTIQFEIPPQANDLKAHIHLAVRTTKKYKYNTLSLKVFIRSNGKQLCATEMDTKVYSHEGNLLGKGFPHSHITLSDSIPVGIQTDSTYTISIVHMMGDKPISGISDIGINIRKQG